MALEVVSLNTSDVSELYCLRLNNGTLLKFLAGLEPKLNSEWVSFQIPALTVIIYQQGLAN
jgi:hypothetical protein